MCCHNYEQEFTIATSKCFLHILIHRETQTNYIIAEQRCMVIKRLRLKPVKTPITFLLQNKVVIFKDTYQLPNTKQPHLQNNDA